MAQFKVKYGSKLKELDAEQAAARAAEAVAPPAASVTTKVRVTRRTASKPASAGSGTGSNIAPPPLAAISTLAVDALKYKELQGECKRRGLSAAGKTEVSASARGGGTPVARHLTCPLTPP